MDVLQIGAGKAVFGHLAHAAVLGVATKEMRQNGADLRLALAATALNDHHALALVAGDQAVTNVFLQGGNVILIQKTAQKTQPHFRAGRGRVVGHRKAAAHDFVIGCGIRAIQKQRPVRHMNPVGLRREIINMRCDFQQLDDVGYLLRNAGGRIRLDDLIDFRLERRYVGHASFRRKEAVFGVEQLVRSQKLPAESRFVDALPVVPGRELVRPQALRHVRSPPLCGWRSNVRCCVWYRRQAESRRCSCASKHLHRTGSQSYRTPAAAHGWRIRSG